ncbi:MAG: hypothetical protein QXU20_04090 [Candidatus Woesearchaeota archaeon]
MIIKEQKVYYEKLEIIANRVLNFLDDNEIRKISDLEKLLSENFFIKHYEDNDFISLRKYENDDYLSFNKKNITKNYGDKIKNKEHKFLLSYNLYLQENSYKIPLEIEVKNNSIKIIVKCYYLIEDYKLCNVDYFNNKIQVKELKTSNLNILRGELKRLTCKDAYKF